jgi:hypothetical protein
LLGVALSVQLRADSGGEPRQFLNMTVVVGSGVGDFLLVARVFQALERLLVGGNGIELEQEEVLHQGGQGRFGSKQRYHGGFRVAGALRCEDAGFIRSRHRSVRVAHGAHDVTVHLLAAAPNRSYLEAHGFGLDRYIAEPLRIEEGCAIAPDRPGHGITFDWQGLDAIRA